MKTRYDFVSNSSSSSFILKDAGFFRHFGITAQDIDDALADLCGGKDALAQRLDDEISKCELTLIKAKFAAEIEPTADNKWEVKYYKNKLRGLKSTGLGLWCIYDMTDAKRRAACFKEWDKHFESWFAPAEGDCETWNKFIDMLNYKCDFDNVQKVIDGKNKLLVQCECNRKTGKTRRKTVPGGAEFIKSVKGKLGVKTMKEVLHDKNCTMMIHFGDNNIYEVRGMTKPGRNETRKKSAYSSESYSAKRFFEILLGYFVEKGKIDFSDPAFLDYWKIGEGDDWYKKNHPGQRYYLEDDKATWEDVYCDMLGCNAIMHEG